MTTILTSGDPASTVAISGTPYTAGLGLSLSSYRFDVSGIDGSMIVDGSVTNDDLQYSTITINGDNGITGGGEISLGGTGTLSGISATTGVKGVVQLQDSAQDGVVDKAITPNAVYDISGGLQTQISTNDTDISNLSGTVSDVEAALYHGWTIEGRDTTSTVTGFVNSEEVFMVTGQGATSVSLGGTDNRTLTINSTDTDTTYTAGTGLVLRGASSTQFNVSGIDTSMIEDGGVHNADLQNSSFVLNAGSGLLITDSATISLGDTRTLNVYTDESTIEVHSDRLRVKDEGITAAKLNSDVNLDAVTDHGATTTNNITVGMIDTSGVRTPISSGAGGATATFDLSTASTFTHTLAANSTTTLAEVNATDGQKFMIRLEQNSAGTGLVNFFSTIRWAGGTAPTLTATTGQIDTFGFLTTPSGNYEGFIIRQNI